MFVRSNSHRATKKLLYLYPTAEAYYYMPKMFCDKSKGYYLIPDNVDISITGISKPKDQNENNYGMCWMK